GRVRSVAIGHLRKQGGLQRLRQPGLDEFGVRRVELDQHRPEAFDHGCLAGGAGAGERVEYGAAGRGDEPDEPAHEAEGFDGSRWGEPQTHPQPPPRSSRADRQELLPDRRHAYVITPNGSTVAVGWALWRKVERATRCGRSRATGAASRWSSDARRDRASAPSRATGPAPGLSAARARIGRASGAVRPSTCRLPAWLRGRG